MFLKGLLVIALSTVNLTTAARQDAGRNALESAAHQQISSPSTLNSDFEPQLSGSHINEPITDNPTSITGSPKSEREIADHGIDSTGDAHISSKALSQNTELSRDSLVWAQRSKQELLDADEAYRMSVQTGGTRKRQTNAAYSDGNGTVTNDCRTAPVYQIRNGTLSVFLGNTQYFYTTNSSVDAQPFIPTLNPGNIARTFRLGAAGEVIWRNAAFDSGQAQFCSMDDGTIYAVFRAAARPVGCLNTRLMLFVASSCARLPEYVVTTTLANGIQQSLATSTSTTTVGVTTITVTYQVTAPASTTTVTTYLAAATTVVTTQPLTTYVTTTTTQSASPAAANPGTVTVVQTVTIPTITSTLTQTTTPPPVTQTTTVASGVVTVSQLPAPTTCNNQGVEYAAFRNNPGYQNNGNFQPEFMKSRAAGGTWEVIYTSGITDGIGGFPQLCGPNPSDNVTVYGNPQSFSCVEFSIMHRFYLFPYMTGTYTFFWEANDDRAWLWIGNNARTGWIGNNADRQTAYLASAQPFTLDLVAGDYYAMRVAFSQGGGGANWGFNVTDPNGQVAWDRNTRASPYIVRRSCDNTTAPQFTTPFGQET
ncbi:hypothetical protein CB0940_09424 [Cercospora beticola]|uniref:PA14 domain-containing protein n=1 Tax=Cercospora beticola TaxID=122368 RepID=A0A2G5HGM2_CERBT|nr:hypothetical protein CB0940_09424 [Cercospora beticola]PIA91690.1 hypothetical protein CB0940_09424 [Cercospora beticola]WPB06260.1 hypothetical protein RHO25_010917 [Cercospora beticola]